MRIEKEEFCKKFEDLEIGDIIETKDNQYMIVKNEQKKVSLMNLKYMQLKNPPYYSILALENQLNHSGVPTHGGSCHEEIIKVHKGRHCKIIIEVFN